MVRVSGCIGRSTTSSLGVRLLQVAGVVELDVLGFMDTVPLSVDTRGKSAYLKVDWR